MTAIFLTVLIASLAGSLHCAGMCGAFVAFAIGVGDPAVRTSRVRLLALYQIGRLVTYSLLGAVAGALGAGIDLGGRLVGIQRTATIMSGILMVGFGGLALLRFAGLKTHHFRVPKGWADAVAAAHRRAARYSPPIRALATGLLTTLIPCGWLYAFVVTAAGTGHAWAGAALMATFWIGTLPMLTVVGVGARRLSGAFAGRLPALSAVAILSVGLYTVAVRAGISLGAGSISRAATPAEVLEGIRSLDQKALPCCTSPATTAPTGGNP